MLPRPTSEPALFGRLSLPVIVLLSLLGYGLIALWFPLVPHIAQVPPGDIRSFAPTLPGGIAYALLVIGLFALLVPAFRRAERSGTGSRPLLFILIGSFLLSLPLLLTYPINATDIYRYVIRGRIASVYGQSPFTVPAAGFTNDPFISLAGEWAGETSPYGPIWELVASGITAISGDNLLAGVLLFKLLALACFLATTVVLWSLLPEGRSRAAYTLLWAWNPALLLIFVVDGHNDALMVLWLTLGYWLTQRGRASTGFLVMSLAALTKPIAVLALPFFFIELFQHRSPDLRRALFITGVGVLLLTWLAFLPWAESGNSLQTTLDLASRLLREATGGAAFSPAVWVYMALGQNVAIKTIGTIAQGLFAAVALWLVWLAIRGRLALRGVADTFYAYIVTALNFRLWYATWPFPWLLLDAGNQTSASTRHAAYRLRAGLWFLLTSQVSVIFYGHVRVHLLGGEHSVTHLIAVPSVFVLPWLLARLPFRISGDEDRV